LTGDEIKEIVFGKKTAEKKITKKSVANGKRKPKKS
jgi:hypothetical protein